MGKRNSKALSTFDKSNIKYYYGITNYSTQYFNSKFSPLEAFEYAYRIGLNFLFLTDHNLYISEEIYFKDSIYSKFQVNKLSAHKIKKKYDNFIPIVGFNCSTSNYGNISIINPNNYFTGIIRDFKILALWMLNNPDSFITINNNSTNLLPHNNILNKLITSVEVSNKRSNNKLINYEKYYFNLLDRGWKLGAINTENNYTLNIRNSENLTACICNNLSSNNIIYSFKERRTYSTESRYLKFYFTINDIFMGEELPYTSKKLRFMIFAEDIKFKIREIQIISNNGIIIRKIENINLNTIKYLYEHTRKDNEDWYIIKILENEDKTAYSSPIFIV